MNGMLDNFQISFWSFRYHLMFSLTGGGKYNFLGTKRWIEDNLDHAGEFFLKCLSFTAAVLINLNMSSPVWFTCNPNFSSPESSLLHDNVAFVLCLDTLANSDELYMHVSRPPKPDTPINSFIQLLEEVTSFTARSKVWCRPISVFMALNLGSFLQVVSSRFPWVKVGLVHKKINLVESTVAWEHERYSLRRIPSFTLSHLEDPKSELRGSILDNM